jgi:hypothetical protein
MPDSNGNGRPARRAGAAEEEGQEEGRRTMKMKLLGGPLDGAVIEIPDRSLEPDMVHFSESRRVHHYGWYHGQEYRYISRDTVLDDRGAFEEWWSGHGGIESAKETAWKAWQAVLSRF